VSSFCVITFPQKEDMAFHASALSTMAAIMAERVVTMHLLHVTVFPACDPPEAAARQNTGRAEAGARCAHIF